ncbi:MAG TPA: SRPBCC domain-containing protein [Verrucomicrobiae bacterium]|nr:SRPBCC domain-containing protein [Verrucomicrobiae bacterium]
MKSGERSGDAIVEEIAIRGTAERIFDALTRPEKLMKWWGAEGRFKTAYAECELRPGGKWRMHVRGAGGGMNIVTGEYRRIERPRLLEFTWIREQEDAVETLVRWELEEERNGVTRVRVTHSGLATEALRKRNSGWPLIVALLRDYLEAK